MDNVAYCKCNDAVFVGADLDLTNRRTTTNDTFAFGRNKFRVDLIPKGPTKLLQ